jgi:hypothetical protein
MEEQVKKIIKINFSTFIFASDTVVPNLESLR